MDLDNNFHKLHYICWWEISVTCQTTCGNKEKEKKVFRLRIKVRPCTALRFTVIVSEAVWFVRASVLSLQVHDNKSNSDFVQKVFVVWPHPAQVHNQGI